MESGSRASLAMLLLFGLVMVVVMMGQVAFGEETTTSGTAEGDTASQSVPLPGGQFTIRENYPVWPARTLRATSCPVHYTFLGVRYDCRSQWDNTKHQNPAQDERDYETLTS